MVGTPKPFIILATIRVQLFLLSGMETTYSVVTLAFRGKVNKRILLFKTTSVNKNENCRSQSNHNNDDNDNDNDDDNAIDNDNGKINAVDIDNNNKTSVGSSQKELRNRGCTVGADSLSEKNCHVNGTVVVE